VESGTAPTVRSVCVVADPVVPEQPVPAVTPAVGFALGSEATGEERACGDGAEAEFFVDQRWAVPVRLLPVAELAVVSVSPAVGEAVRGDSTGVVVPGVDVDELETPVYQLRGVVVAGGPVPQLPI